MQSADFARKFSFDILTNADVHHQRTGQYLFNGLPFEAQLHVRGTLFDPFYKNMSQYQIEEWLNNHVFFNEQGSIVGIFENDQILWERKY